MEAQETIPAKVKTLDSEVLEFAESLPYWAKFLASKILLGIDPTRQDYLASYGYLLEEFGLKKETKKDEIKMNYAPGAGSFKDKLVLSKLMRVEGVNALEENQVIEFGPQVTILYGGNGSGKSGYARLLKNAFFSRHKESILSNIRASGKTKEITAQFQFETDKSYALSYPKDETSIEFQQFAVFDDKCVLVHLDNRNDFRFKPSGLNFFAWLAECYAEVDGLINADIAKLNTPKDYTAFFDGDSEIKKILNQISDKTDANVFDKYLPYSAQDKERKKTLEEKKAELAAKKVGKEISDFEELLELIAGLKTGLIGNNKSFAPATLNAVDAGITDCIAKAKLVKEKGIESFKSTKIKNIGGEEWKDFIEAATVFAEEQGKSYPTADDSCILCQQPLSSTAERLIAKYFEFIASEIEQEAKDAQDKLNEYSDYYDGMEFDLIPPASVLHKFFSSKYPATLKTLLDGLDTQSKTSKSIKADIKRKIKLTRKEVQIDGKPIDTVVKDINKAIAALRSMDPSKEIAAINKELTFLNHKQLLEKHHKGILDYISNLIWVKQALEAKRSTNTLKITSKEKSLSAAYFNEAYTKTFNEECKVLNGDSFGIEIQNSGTTGASFRKLKIKNHNPSAILSEGEQKVISLADFLSEIRHSGINRGIIFDDPVTSLDDARKSLIADRLALEGNSRQVIVFTHDLVFLFGLLESCKERKINAECHWVENNGGKPGLVYLRNTPSAEEKYKTPTIAQEFYNKAQKSAGPEEKELHLKLGYAALRTTYESLVVYELFNGVVQRFKERVSIDGLGKVHFDVAVRDMIIDGFANCCRHMEGHLHSDKYAYEKPTPENLIQEINRFVEIKKKVKEAKSAINMN